MMNKQKDVINQHNKLLDGRDLNNMIQRLSYQILENNTSEDEIVLVGIEKNGVLFAEKLKAELHLLTNKTLLIGSLRIDKSNPVHTAGCSISSEGYTHKSVIIIDDVLNTGSTLAYAVRYFLGVVLSKLQVLVIVNRNHKKFPIQPDFEGISLSTSINEEVKVILNNDYQGVYIY